MNRPLRIGIAGDFRPESRYHRATNEALAHAGQALNLIIDCSWIATPALSASGYAATLQAFDALWCAPGSPYASMAGALNAIRFARERGKPFVGT